MKILLLSDIFPPQTGGSGRWFWEIYRRMPQDSVVIAAGEHPRQESFDRTHQFNLHRLPLAMSTWGTCSIRGCVGYLRSLRSVARMVRQHHIERVHCGRLLPEGWIARLLKLTKGVPYVCYVHGEDLNLGTLSRELEWMMRRILAGAEFLIANSRNTASLLGDRWQVPHDRIRLMHPGVDTTKFSPAAPDRAVRKTLGWDDRPVVLTVGRLQKRKGHDRLILAVNAIRREMPDILYCIVGDGEERAELAKLVRTYGLEQHVQFRSEVDDQELVQCYQQCDLFALPNREVNGDIEGFGMVLLEAQACGKPVIAGASGGTAETMRVPQTGRIVPCEGPEELARVIPELLRNPAVRAEMGAAGRQWVVEHFSWESLSQQAYALFFPERAGVPGDSTKASSSISCDAAVAGRD